MKKIKQGEMPVYRFKFNRTPRKCQGVKECRAVFVPCSPLQKYCEACKPIMAKRNAKRYREMKASQRKRMR